MSVPEASVHKNNSAVLRKYDVRLSRQIISVQAKPEAKLVEKGAHFLFRCCIGGAHAAHYLASFFW